MLEWMGITLAGWLLGFLILFLAGSILNWLSLRTIRHPLQTAEFGIGRTELLIRWLYQLVIFFTSAYYYLSILLIVLLVVFSVGGSVYLSRRAGIFTIPLIIITGSAAGYTLYVMIKSVLNRLEQGEIGRFLGQSEAPELWTLTREVAARSGTRPVDAIYITPASRIGVTERGSALNVLRGSGQRCLVLGLGLLNGMKQGQFKSILAHEYGHFVIHDTAGDILAWPVQASMNAMREDLTRLHLTKWYNPAWLFYKSYTRLFLRITQGSSRLHESLADRHATLTYGIQNYVSGLTHLACQSILFRFQVDAEVNRANLESEHLHNLYDLPLPPLGERRDWLKEKISMELLRPTRAYDSHLSLRERIALLEKSSVVPAGENPDDSQPVWRLLPNAAGLQEEMTAFVQANVDKRAGKNNLANNTQDKRKTLAQTLLDNPLQ